MQDLPRHLCMLAFYVLKFLVINISMNINFTLVSNITDLFNTKIVSKIDSIENETLYFIILPVLFNG